MPFGDDNFLPDFPECVPLQLGPFFVEYVDGHVNAGFAECGPGLVGGHWRHSERVWSSERLFDGGFEEVQKRPPSGTKNDGRMLALFVNLSEYIIGHRGNFSSVYCQTFPSLGEFEFSSAA
jgi:hypothetical protein